MFVNQQERDKEREMKNEDLPKAKAVKRRKIKKEFFAFFTTGAYLVNCHLSSNPLSMHFQEMKHD